MTDNELIQELQKDILNAVNKSHLPMGVKVLALENILLKANSALQSELVESSKSKTSSEEVKEDG